MFKMGALRRAPGAAENRHNEGSHFVADMTTDASTMPKSDDGSAGYGASDITVLEGLEAVRKRPGMYIKRPGMYIGSTGERGLHHLVYEVVDNSVDEALAGYADHIEVTIQADGGVKVVDNGRGIPVDIHPTEGKPTVEVVMTILHAGGKFGGGGYAVSGGLHGVGISVVNALSVRVDTEIRRQGHVWRMSFANGGHPTTELVKGEETTETGTTQVFYPDPEIFETVVFDYETLRARFQQMAFLNKGLRITLIDERPEALDALAGDEIAGDEEAEKLELQHVRPARPPAVRPPWIRSRCPLSYEIVLPTIRRFLKSSSLRVTPQVALRCWVVILNVRPSCLCVARSSMSKRRVWIVR